MRPHLALLAAVPATLALGHCNPTVRNVFTFGPNVFVEGIAVRANSHILLTSLSVPTLYTLDPTAATPSAAAVHTFPNTTGICGIAEVSPDTFALVTGIWDLANTRAEPGSLAVWTVNVAAGTPVVRRVTGVENSRIINGLARHPTNPSVLLGADSAAGAVWGINLVTGAKEILFSSPLFEPVGTAPGTNLGINGLKARDSHIYFTNSAKGIFGKVPIDVTGNQSGPISIVSNSSAGVIYDDIALDEEKEGVAWIASHPSFVVRVGADGGQRLVNDTAVLLNPTAAAFGRGGRKERRTLYVTNGGEFAESGDLVHGGLAPVEVC